MNADDRPGCAICRGPLSLTRTLPHLVCRQCAVRATTITGERPRYDEDFGVGDKMVYIDDIKCRREYGMASALTYRICQCSTDAEWWRHHRRI